MQAKVINPYTKLGNKHKESLDYIIANLPPNPTFDDLNDQLTDSFFMPDPNDPNPLDLAVSVIKTVLPHAYNGYVNGGVRRKGQGATEKTSEVSKTSEVFSFITQMLAGINNVPEESIGDYLIGIEEEIVSCDRDAMHCVPAYEEQIPLLIAAQIGKSDHEYWMGQINTPGTWAAYLNADYAINYAHVAGWVSASMQGALLTYGLIKPPQIQLLDMFSSTIGSTGLAAGKVIFGWLPRYTV